MCGIFGVVSDLKFRDKDYGGFVKDAFVAGSLRGEDSSGIFQLDSKFNLFLQKYAEPGWDIIKRKHVLGIIEDTHNSPITVAHNRAATMGAIKPDNAHPFELHTNTGDTLVGVHNGTLNGWKNQVGASNFDVDSEWALALIQTEGLDAFKKINGAYAMVWWDSRTPGVLNIARNNERPLHYAYVNGRGTMLFASEHGMLSWLADRNHVSLEDKIYVVEPGTHYKIDTKNPREIERTTLPKNSWSNPYTPSYPRGASSPVAPAYTPATGPTLSANETLEESALVKKITEILSLKRKAFVSSEEIRMAKEVKIYNEEYELMPAFYDDATLTIWGEVTVDGQIMLAELRRMSKTTYWAWEREGTSQKVKVIGAYKAQDESTILVVARSRVPSVVVDTTSSVAVN